MRRLLIFPHSHFCEKARWALDHKRLDYEPVAVFPGLHVRTVRRIAPASSLPVLISGDTVIQGSNEIIDYLDDNLPGRPLTPTGAEARNAAIAIEQQLDQRLGVPIRQILYASLLDHPEFIAQCFSYSMPWWKRQCYPMLAPGLRKAIYAGYVKSEAATAAGRATFDEAMSELAATLDGRDYLLGDTFTRADLAAAALLSLLALPPEHPFPWGEVPASDARTFIETYADHPVAHWVRKIYRDYRQPAI